jgi:cytochrome bd ubiquinol oxidase subunit II
METFWFLIVALMLTVYVILDGFDLGAGIVLFVTGRTAAERQTVLRAIGPFWDGNEVWLLAAGGTLYFAFPVLYSASFSGFYLPLTMLRGLGIELRGHSSHPQWHSFFDFIFALSSSLLAVFFGAALGNVVRGVPLNSEGYFFEPLWTNFRVGQDNGILDWFTVLAGLLALAALAMHGASYVALKAVGEVNARARQLAIYTGWVVLGLTLVSLAATLYIRPDVMNNYRAHLWGLILPLGVLASLILIQHFHRRGRERAAFLASSAYLACMLGGAAFAVYPQVLPASTNPAYSLTIHNAAAGSYGLGVGMIWWTIGIVLAIGYFAFLYRTFRGKVSAGQEGYF